MDDSAKQSEGSAPFSFAVVALALVLAIGVLWMCHHGIGLASDTASYFRFARSMAVADLPVHHGILYPLILGGLSGALGDPSRAALVVSLVLCMAVTAVWLMGLRWMGVSSGWGVVASLAVLLSLPVYESFAWAMSDALFLLLQVIVLLSLGRWMFRETGTACFWVAVTASSLSLLTRYAGGALLLTGMMVFLGVGKGGWGRRLLRVGSYAFFSILPLLLVLLWNHFRYGSATNRDYGWHPVPLSTVEMGLYHVLNWFLPGSLVDKIPPWIQFVMVAAMSVSLVMVAFRLRAPWRLFVRVLIVFSVAYSLFLLLAISVADISIMLDQRMLAPLAATLIALVVLSFAGILDRLGRVGRVLVILGITLWLSLYGLRAVSMVKRGYEQGWGFASVEWKKSPTMDAVRRMDPRVKIYSNAPDVIFLLTGKETPGLPFTMSPVSHRGRSAYEEARGRMNEEFSTGRAVLAVFSNRYWAVYLPRKEELVTDFRLSRRDVFSDGELWNGPPIP